MPFLQQSGVNSKKGLASQRSGFTLIELMVVISIIAILSIIGITIFTGVQKSARDTKRKADLHAMQLALEQYKLANGTYPDTNYTWYNSASTTWAAGLGLDPYMRDLPVDPKNSPATNPQYGGYTYAYLGFSNGLWFVLAAHLENPSPSDLKTKCISPTSGQVFGNTGDTSCTSNSPPNACYANTYWVCNQL